MKAWHIENADDVKLTETTVSRNVGEVKLKVGKVSLTSCDIRYFLENEGAVVIPGHSAVAYVSEADADSDLKLGARAVVSPFVRAEEHGVSVVKIMGMDVDGLLCDFICVPQENVYVLPDGISDEDALYAEYIALGIKMFSGIETKKGDYVVIAGANTLGLLLSQLAIYYQMVPILIDLDTDKLKLASNFGVYYTLNPTYDNLERKVEEITGGRMSEFAMFVGECMPFSASLRLLKDGGEAVIGGYTSIQKHQIDTDTMLKKQLTVKGVSDGDGEMPSAINLLANKIVKTEGIINGKTSFEDFPAMVKECAEYPYKYNNILITLN
jgi:threonine dehydrogenase-like Zn-dependent dehydrogenase